MAAKPEVVRDRHIDRTLLGHVRGVVQVAIRIRVLVIDRRGDDAVVDGQAADGRLDASQPAAPSRWPVIDLVEEMEIWRAASPKVRLMANVSQRSLIGVEVPWALM